MVTVNAVIFHTAHAPARFVIRSVRGTTSIRMMDHCIHCLRCRELVDDGTLCNQ